MPTRITRQDLDNLAGKIAGLNLDEHEQTVLLAIFALAADALGRKLPDAEVHRSTPGVSVTQMGELPDIATIFDQAFTPTLAATGGDGDGKGSDDTVSVQLGKIGR
jgi:hypothetical protein